VTVVIAGVWTLVTARVVRGNGVSSDDTPGLHDSCGVDMEFEGIVEVAGEVREGPLTEPSR